MQEKTKTEQQVDKLKQLAEKPISDKVKQSISTKIEGTKQSFTK